MPYYIGNIGKLRSCEMLRESYILLLEPLHKEGQLLILLHPNLRRGSPVTASWHRQLIWRTHSVALFREATLHLFCFPMIFGVIEIHCPLSASLQWCNISFFLLQMIFWVTGWAFSNGIGDWDKQPSPFWERQLDIFKWYFVELRLTSHFLWSFFFFGWYFEWRVCQMLIWAFWREQVRWRSHSVFLLLSPLRWWGPDGNQDKVEIQEKEQFEKDWNKYFTSH